MHFLHTQKKLFVTRCKSFVQTSLSFGTNGVERSARFLTRQTQFQKKNIYRSASVKPKWFQDAIFLHKSRKMLLVLGNISRPNQPDRHLLQNDKSLADTWEYTEHIHFSYFLVAGAKIPLSSERKIYLAFGDIFLHTFVFVRTKVYRKSNCKIVPEFVRTAPGEMILDPQPPSAASLVPNICFFRSDIN